MISTARNLLLVAAAGCALAACDDLLGDPKTSFGEATEAARGEPLAKVVKLDGPASLIRPGRTELAREGEAMFGEDALETGAESEARIRFRNGQELEVGPDARLVITEKDGAPVLNVVRGLVLSRVPAAEQAPSGERGAAAAGPAVALTILTPFGITRVQAGGEVAVDVKGDDASIDVKLGSIELVSRNGTVTQAAAGERVQVTGGEVQLLGRSRKVIELEPIQVTVYASFGKAEIRKKGEARWAQVKKTGVALGEGDAVRATRTGRTQLRLAGTDSRLTLEPTTEITYDGSGRTATGDEARITLKKGALDVSLSKERNSRLLIGDLALESSEGGQFSVLKTKDGYEVAAYAGDVKVEQNGKAQVVKAGQQARLAPDGAAQVSEVARSELVLASVQGSQVYHPGVPDAAITWGGQEGEYVVQVATDAQFKDMVREGKVHQNFVNVPPPPRGALHWRVFNKEGTQVARGSATFGKEAASRSMARLRNEVPEGSEKTTIFYQDRDQPPAVTFTYRRDMGASKYKVAVFRVDDLETPVAEKVTDATKVALEAGALTEGGYVWSVTPMTAAGEPVRGGKMNQLDLVFDNSVASLEVSKPSNGDRLSGKTVEATGIAPVGAKVFVNGRPVEVDEKNRFRAQVAPLGRPPVVIFRMTRSNEPDVFTIRTLRRGK